MASISFICPYCRSAPMASPEQLCLHVEKAHNEQNLMAEQGFSSGHELERWLNRVEESRCEGGILGADEGRDVEETEFYILCSRKATPQLKRRRLNPEETESKETLVSCTAFVHIEERMDGTFHVKYCLDHTADCEVNDEKREPVKARKTMKRRSQEELETAPCSSSAGSIRPCQTALRRRQDVFDLSSMNRFLSHRIDHAASSLKALNQMIADLAMDLNNRLWDRPPLLVPVHYPYPNEIYIS